MAQPLVSRYKRGVLAVKAETTYATDAVLANTNIIEVRNIVSQVNQAQFRDERMSGFVVDLPDIPGIRSVTLSFDCLLRGAGVAYSASVKPEVDALLQALGFTATGSFVALSESWTYTSSNGATIGAAVTAALFPENAPQVKALGCFGSGRITQRAGEPGIFAVTLQGLYVAPTDQTLITQAPSNIIPPVLLSAALTIDAIATHRASMFDIDLGIDVQPIPSANANAGYAGWFIAGRRPTLSIDPEQVPVATYNWHAKRDAASLVAASAQLGTVQYNRVRYTAPKLQVLDIRDGQRNGLRINNIAAKLNANVGGDELTIVFD